MLLVQIENLHACGQWETQSFHDRRPGEPGAARGGCDQVALAIDDRHMHRATLPFTTDQGTLFRPQRFSVDRVTRA
jgi:hypothetical protein